MGGHLLHLVGQPAVQAHLGFPAGLQDQNPKRRSGVALLEAVAKTPAVGGEEKVECPLRSWVATLVGKVKPGRPHESPGASMFMGRAYFTIQPNSG